ncbi:AAA family ATPase [Nocardia gipuzkoensis]|uniref:AAA family ATPase n=1 Tax=Nocardia gipuzkoensis TaxID=2749991 RepID=UPI001E33F5A3|nr:AAA family ATPase [Nocardia gipuzkoensis]UGT65558.1 AAA family ATPase [Nocardia gipuzkoensis]
MRLDPDAVQAAGSADATPRLSEVVTRRLAEDPAVTPSVSRTVLRALGAAESDDATTTFDHSGIFLSAIRVCGFRGIGPETTLQLPPGPGLTLVVGRNGSGKSSFAEAAELALTGGNRRWDGRSAAWREGWRNLHEGAAARIELELLTAGDAPRLTITKVWAPDADLSDAHWTQRYPPAPPSVFDTDRWAAQLELYRPFLSYSELGALVDGKPSDLFDALHQLLGLDELTLAQERIRMRRLQLERAVRDSRQERLELLELLASVADDRAVRVAGLLRPAQPDLAAVGREVLGVVDDPAGPDGLRAIVRLALPDDAEVEAVASRLEACGDALAQGATADAEADLRLLGLLRKAREHQAASGTCPCPICGRGALDEAWVRETDAAIEQLAARVDALTTARIELGNAVRAARALPDLVPAELDFDPRNPPSVDTTAVRGAWADWAALTTAEYTPELPERLRVAHARLVDELDLLQQGTRKELDRLDEVWTPLVPRIVAWLDGAREVAAHAAELRTVKRAEDWLKSATAGLRGERMTPLETTARWVWRTLRQQSNVELGAIRLQGNAGTARRVLLDVTVDEVDGAALGVMSQGELHALGLSLFLPRATVEESPFRFVMIDDPVQAMDPAKVDGLAQVLATVAWTRQVVVFTHDERLAEAVRRMQLDATVLEVQRRDRSVVEVRVSSDPIRRYLDDARALVRTPQLPAAIADELVATCCRSAVEAASLARARRTLLAAGMNHNEVERHIDAAHSTRAKVALAVFGVGSKVDDLNKNLIAREGRWVVDALRDATAGAHVPIGRDMRELIGETEKFVAWLVR